MDSFVYENSTELTGKQNACLHSETVVQDFQKTKWYGCIFICL